MILLFQAVKEYLADAHPSLEVIHSKYHTELFIQPRLRTVFCKAHIRRITLIANTNRMIAQHRHGTYNYSYTESTIIEQIESIIDKMYEPVESINTSHPRVLD